MAIDPGSRYDACLWWTLDNPCNLDCAYCCAVRKSPKNPPIRVDRLLSVLEETGKVFRLHFTSIGEPFVTPGFVDALVEITKYHHVSFNTNLVAKSIPQFARRVPPDKVVEIVASLYIDDLDRCGATDRYIENFLELKQRSFRIRAQVVAHPSLLSRLASYREHFRDQGVEFTCNHFIGVYDGKRYPEAYTENDRRIFGEEISVGVRWRHQSGTPCNAGYNIAVVQPDGSITRCYDVQRSLGNIYRRISFDHEVATCPSDSCSCALNRMDERLDRMSRVGDR